PPHHLAPAALGKPNCLPIGAPRGKCQRQALKRHRDLGPMPLVLFVVTYLTHCNCTLRPRLVTRQKYFGALLVRWPSGNSLLSFVNLPMPHCLSKSSTCWATHSGAPELSTT